MKVFRTKKAIKEYILEQKNRSKSIGFVPTMGALHDGHISLINKAIEKCDLCICSIFVNPTQFNNAIDLQNYPRTETNDLRLLEENACHAVFIPTVSEIYKSNEKLLDIKLGSIGEIMEATYRPGHFAGVITIVYKLFDIVNPTQAFFGLKDYQQYLVIKKMVEVLDLNVEIIPCEIYREKSGLAMSSRNKLLSEKGKTRAAFIYNVLTEAKNHFLSQGSLFAKEFVYKQFKENTDFELEYFTIADADNLKLVDENSTHTNCRAFIACVFEGIRLIDNIDLSRK
jgi:pantoate--beta-alanine ligase